MEEVVTRVCTFRLQEAGYVHATMHDGSHFEAIDAKDAVAATWAVAGEMRRPVLVDMRGVRSQTREAREYFMSEEATAKMCAVALLVSSPMSRVIGNFFLRLGTHHIPTQLFTDDTDARNWLGEHRP